MEWKEVKVNKKKSPKICEEYKLYGRCKCFDKNNKQHPFICTNIENNGICKLKDCRFFHPTNYEIKKKKNSILCELYINYGYCECKFKENKGHPKICKDYINKKCDKSYKECEFFHIKKLDQNEKLCMDYDHEGLCKKKNCNKIHPTLCKIIGCINDNNCRYFHPIKFPPICHSINNNSKCNYFKCLFYHPKICNEINCSGCEFYHPIKLVTINDIIKWSKNKNFEECINYYHEKLEKYIDDENENIILNIRKYLCKNHRYDILNYLLEKGDRIILNPRRYNETIHVYSLILWPNTNDYDWNLFYDNCIKTMNIFIDKKFDLYCFNNKWNESIFGVIKNKENKIPNDLKKKLILYFLKDYQNNRLENRSFLNMWNLISPKTKSKMWKYLQFLLYKNKEDCISYLINDLFKSHGNQLCLNIDYKIKLIFELLSEIPKNDNDMFDIYELVFIDWKKQLDIYQTLFLNKISLEYNKDKINLTQNCKRFGSIIGLFYKNNIQKNEIKKILSNYNNDNIIDIFLEWAVYGIDIHNYEESKFILNEFQKNIFSKNKREKFEIERIFKKILNNTST